MTEKQDRTNKECVCIDIPTALYERVENYCKANGIESRDFIFDALSEKLRSIHKEKRRKPRL